MTDDRSATPPNPGQAQRGSHSVQTTPKDLKVQIKAQRLLIEWGDGCQHEFALDDLRRQCPCATCRDERNAKKADPQSEAQMALPVLSGGEAKPLRIDSMRPVGAYAYNIVFSDGHSSGIFTFAMLSRS